VPFTIPLEGSARLVFRSSRRRVGVTTGSLLCRYLGTRVSTVGDPSVPKVATAHAEGAAITKRHTSCGQDQPEMFIISNAISPVATRIIDLLIDSVVACSLLFGTVLAYGGILLVLGLLVRAGPNRRSLRFGSHARDNQSVSVLTAFPLGNGTVVAAARDVIRRRS